ncbi:MULTISPECIES: LytR/AlgR family response regulator transcription factor [Bacillota]|jgi:DNA-binding LytR/AlgR family response regulator|uniref:Response regulator n=2 Tax=Amedibacillus TaxID=2749846 RepID=A0A7G9GPZ1_9FIRM|nr:MULTISPECIES: response regulator [Bacillota]QNM12873.1 response regulator [[Eubacterium] hominis]MCH4286754.1 response regulator [Amedibacillus hominis]RGB58166.1 response regulator [Absiella sp. AM22-9]RGB59939.1 response regulator [Absiella sp. AM10-20]RGB66024.1 response regulator [Absiella sp. AM09-45]
MKIIFIEDTKEDMELIKNIVEKFHEITPLYFLSAAEFYASEEEADAVILDIDIPDENGLLIAKKLREHDYEGPIVFVSWYQEYEHESFNVHPFRFVRKDKLDVEMTICLKELIIDFNRRNGKLFYNYENKSFYFYSYDILYIEREKNGVIIHFTDNSEKKIRGLSLQIVLNQYIYGFHQINKSMIINFYHVIRYSMDDTIILKNDIALEVSRNRRKSLMSAYREFRIR